MGALIILKKLRILSFCTIAQFSRMFVASPIVFVLCLETKCSKRKIILEMRTLMRSTETSSLMISRTVYKNTALKSIKYVHVVRNIYLPVKLYVRSVRCTAPVRVNAFYRKLERISAILQRFARCTSILENTCIQ